MKTPQIPSAKTPQIPSAKTPLQLKNEARVIPGQKILFQFSLLPSEYLYLNTFSSPHEGLRFIIRESMSANLSESTRKEFRDKDV